jgi:alpha-L-fucosidase
MRASLAAALCVASVASSAGASAVGAASAPTASAPPPAPSKQVLAWTQREIGAMISFDMITELTNVSNSQHFCINVGGDRGFALPPATAYAPSQLSTDSWLDAAVAMGAKYSVLVAMHCSGFAQWATNVSGANGTGGFEYTYSTAYSGGAAVDVVASYMASSASHGVLPGFYYSLNENYYLNVGSGKVQPSSTLTPGQANVSQETYIAIAVAQQVELWRKYEGLLSEVWVSKKRTLDPRRSLS